MKWHFNTMELRTYQTSKQGDDRKHTALVKDKRGHKVLRTSPDLWFYDIMNRIKRCANNKVLPTLNLTTYQQTTKRGNPTAKREKSKQNKSDKHIEQQWQHVQKPSIAMYIKVITDFINSQQWVERSVLYII
jgi:3-oxoacyl-[acyl-carrier-protein] synthase III